MKLHIKTMMVVFSSMALLTSVAYPYAYLPDTMSLSHALFIIAHNSPQAKAYGWRYYQQLGTLEDQWKAGARGGKINLHWHKPMSKERQLALEAKPRLLQKLETLKKKEKYLKYKIQQKKQEKKTAKILKKAKLFAEIKKIQFTRESILIVINTTEKALRAIKEVKTKPYIGLCHEPDAKSNCLLSATLQKKDKINNAEDYFRKFAQLLAKNPKDVIIIVIDDYLDKRSSKNGADQYTPQQVKQKLHEMFTKSGIAKFAYKLQPKHYPQGDNPAALLPTIGEMRKTGKRAILLIDHVAYHAEGSPFLNDVWKRLFRRTRWAFDWKADLKAGVCQLRTNPPGAKAFMIDHGPESSIPKKTTKSKLIALMKKLKIKPKTIESSDYKYINSKEVIRRRLNHCAKASPGTPPSILNLDFVEIGQASQVVREINMERARKLGL